MASTTTSFPVIYMKPIIAGGLVFVADRFLMGEHNMNKSLMLGASAGGGVALGCVLGTYLPDLGITSPVGDTKTIMQRAIEVGAGAGGAYVLNAYVINSARLTTGALMQNAGLILAADFISEYICDYVQGSPLSYLS